MYDVMMHVLSCTVVVVLGHNYAHFSTFLVCEKKLQLSYNDIKIWNDLVTTANVHLIPNNDIIIT